METISTIYKNLCPNCGNDITDDRLKLGLTCEACLDRIVPKEQICNYLKIEQFKSFCNLREHLSKFKNTFKNTTGFNLSSLQEMWAIRFFLDNSFALIAETGIGKTTFGLTLSKYISENNIGFVYLIFPTNILVKQAKEKLLKFGIAENEIIAYDSNLPKNTLELLKYRIQEGDFKILITTTNFLYKNFDMVPKGLYSLVFIDDVDSILKNSKNIDKVLKLLNFNDEDIEKALKLIDLKRLSLKNKVDQETLQSVIEDVNKIKAKRKGVLIVSSATTNPKSKKVLLFRELLNFEVGRVVSTLRKVVDTYKIVEGDLFSEALSEIKKLGKGGLIFLNTDYTKEDLENFVHFLNKNGVKALSYEHLTKVLEDFKQGSLDVLVGFSTYRNPLARGIDLPSVIRYALFVGVPKIKFSLSATEGNRGLYYAILMLAPHITRKKILKDSEVAKIYRYLNILKRYSNVIEESGDNPYQKAYAEAVNYFKELFKREDIVKIIEETPDIALQRKGNELSFVVVDTTGYIQASGRTSRLIATGLTKGLSLILTNDLKALLVLGKKLKWFIEDALLLPYETVNIESILKEIDDDRALVRKIESGFLTDVEPKFDTKLVIVESPNKARTIASFYGKPIRRRIGNLDAFEIIMKDTILTIAASKGHILDLNKTEGYFGVLKRDGIFIPLFEPIDEDKENILKSLRRLSLEVNEVLLASDPDTEGEKISYDLWLNLSPYANHIKRIEFHEVTKHAFEDAIKNPRNLNINLVKAQFLRRIADRFVGFTVSQYIQKEKGLKTLSAGRVQTPVLEWIVNRGIEASKKNPYLRVFFSSKTVEFKLESTLNKEEIDKVKTIYVKILDRHKENLFVKPFETYTLLKEASNKLKLPSFTIMQLAQDLFEMGLITYHRTDSIKVSETGVRIAKEYIEENFGSEFVKIRMHSQTQGAHECIRPTKAMDVEELKSYLTINPILGITPMHLKLYDLIFRQFIASQMKDTVVEGGKVLYSLNIGSLTLQKEEEVNIGIVEEGFNKIHPVEIYPVSEGIIPIENKLLIRKSDVPFYTHATIIEEMEKKGIGRPSTYAITIEKLIARKYVIDKKGFLIPTKLGAEIVNLIKKNMKISPFVSEGYTKELEQKMDKIEQGSGDYNKEIEKIFNDLQLEKLKEFLSLSIED
ncbi:reverse gyrase [Caldisericum exile]|uniref:Reverse gyrase n=1 Tax=Caldisericum exile (strain DSM 21853 / NBRC 104410 / AZM16c01) TaxID=511051 RepID=A0A7U6GFY6_CALEA|nr:reverse gyrase [Caldisericum exile]BAL81683.1 reverse gyrase [Caldisericum exile AZM16c01]